MPSIDPICNLQACSRPVHPESFACPSCLEVPLSDYHSTQNSWRYCCEEHFWLDVEPHRETCAERQNWRTLSRVGALYNLLFLTERNAMSLQCIVAERWMSGDKCQVWMEDMAVGKPMWPYNPLETTGNGRAGAMSFGQCIYITNLLRPLLAWLLNGTNTQVQTIDFIPKRDGQVLVADRKGRDWLWRVPGDIHTILLLKQPGHREGLVLDGTSMQYLEPARCHLSPEYYRKKVQHFLGDSSMAHRHRPITLENIQATRPEDLALDISMKTINKKVVENITRLGGREAFFRMRDIEFWQTAQKIDRAVYFALWKLRSTMEHTVLHNFKLEPVIELMTKCNGNGHQQVMEAHERCKANGDRVR